MIVQLATNIYYVSTKQFQKYNHVTIGGVAVVKETGHHIHGTVDQLDI